MVTYTISRYTTHIHILVYTCTDGQWGVYPTAQKPETKKKNPKENKKKNKKENHTNKIIFDFICIIVMYSVAKSKAEAKTNLLTTN